MLLKVSDLFFCLQVLPILIIRYVVQLMQVVPLYMPYIPKSNDKQRSDYSERRLQD